MNLIIIYSGVLLFGFFLSLTPIPYLPCLLIPGIYSQWKVGVVWALIALVGSATFIAFPFVLIWLIYQKLGFAGAAVFSIAMYSISIWGIIEKALARIRT